MILSYISLIYIIDIFVPALIRIAKKCCSQQNTLFLDKIFKKPESPRAVIDASATARV